MDSDTVDLCESSEKPVEDNLLIVGELCLSLSDNYTDLSSPPVTDLADLGYWHFDTNSNKQATSPKQLLLENSSNAMSLLVGNGVLTETLFERLAHAVPGHEVRRSQLDEAYMMCNSRKFQLIWLVMSTPVSQEILSFTTSIRYMYNSRLNKSTKIIGVSDKKPDVDLQHHGIDGILVEPVTDSAIRGVYMKWSSLQVNSEMAGPATTMHDDLTIEERSKEQTSNDKVVKMEEDNASVLPLGPLLAALQEVRNTYQPRPKLPTVSDHTSKEKMRRERIKDSCDQLRVLLPYIRGRKTDMASVLEICVDYLRIVNVALPNEFKNEVADILGKECQLIGEKGRGTPKSTPRKRKRDLSKQPQSPCSFAPSSAENSPMYTPPATPGSESSDSVASPMAFNAGIEQNGVSPQDSSFVKLETLPFETSVTAPKALLPQIARSRSNKTPTARPQPTYITLPQNDLYKMCKNEDLKNSNITVQRDMDFFKTHSNPSCFPFSPFNRSNDLSLSHGNFFPSSFGGNVMMPSMDLDEPVCRFPAHSGFSFQGNSGMSMDPLVNYVNPNAVLPVMYPFSNSCIDSVGITMDAPSKTKI